MVCAMIMIIGTLRCKAGIIANNAGRKSCFAVRDHECDSYCRILHWSVNWSVCSTFRLSIDSNPEISMLPNVRQTYANRFTLSLCPTIKRSCTDVTAAPYDSASYKLFRSISYDCIPLRHYTLG